MSGDPYRKAIPGERLKIPARAWNRLMDDVGVTPGFQAETGGAYSAPYSRIMVQPSFAEGSPAWPRWSPVFLMSGLFGYQPTLNPTTGAERSATTSFESMPIFVALGSPAYASYTSRMAGILLEPLNPGGIGWAAVAGVVQTKVFNGAANYQNSQLKAALYAKLIGGPVAQGPARLTTDWFEGYRILWREHGRLNEETWALVDLSNHHCQQLVYLKATQDVRSGNSSTSDAFFKPHAHFQNALFELPYSVTARNDLIDLKANACVWALHPGAYDLYHSSPGGGQFRVVALADMTQAFEATAIDNGTNSFGAKRYTLSLESYPA